MIKFAVKSLVVLVLVGHAMKLADPAEPGMDGPRFIPATYAEGAPLPERDVTRDLSTLTNVQIVVSRTARDATGFCEREPLACQSGRQLLVQLATGVRDMAASLAGWAEEDESATARIEEEYRPLKAYSGNYPILPEAPPVRSNSL
ncbi:hypothetical protein [Parvibaculum sp.]|jgi:hypothetical protein|uniref:hypothetical protein n=1 Tax=Parvibaculum sp. TaxID=2024848 RepID=UPI000C67CAAD|nr:hypothetical protein [Parvibaculum sp.]MAM94531.1 hypothetical protein [Parvibaculum sp.]HCX68789.1 hypothetical protein [Rhodobiaceae bacterium]|tara:strand:- start:43139 stop:43576 length:438 start_codon:yes stop_codon:yes gene_type:complete